MILKRKVSLRFQYVRNDFKRIQMNESKEENAFHAMSAFEVGNESRSCLPGCGWKDVEWARKLPYLHV